MAEKVTQSLEGVSKTLLIPLYVRAREAQRPDAMIKDEAAVEMVKNIECDFSSLRMQRHDEIATILRMKKFDSLVSDFLSKNPNGVVVHIGCGLDTRFERVDNGRVEWFDLDLPEVIALRNQLISSDNNRCHKLRGSVFEHDWLKEVERFKTRPFIFAAEGVFPYFEEAQVKALFLNLRDHFPGAELACDAHTPFVLRMDNVQLALSKIPAHLQWGLKHGKDVEGWGDGIVMLEEWFYFDDDEPHMRRYRWMRHFPLLGKSTGIFHYRLGNRELQ